MNDNWQVYLLKCSDDTFYCGITTDLERRLLEHNGFRRGGARYTATRKPVELLTASAGLSRSDALRLEAAIKRLPRSLKLATLKALADADS